MNAFDFSILSFLNQFVGKCRFLDSEMVHISNDGFLMAGPIVACCCWAWFKHGEEADQRNFQTRQSIFSAIMVCFMAILLSRLIVMMFAFRLRPLSDPTNGLQFPPGTSNWEHWSSFPSDHAIMFFTLTTCLFFASRLLGWISLLDTVFLVCLPRIYLGIHYPTDIIAGAAIGVAVGLAAQHEAVRKALANRPLQWMQVHPGPFYAAFFIFMYQMSTIFSDVRYVGVVMAKELVKVVKGL
jgi:hypothetical protein